MGKTHAVERLERPQYEPLTSITRCLHLEDAMRCYKKRKLIAHRVNSSVVDVKGKVLWFASTMSMEEHNFYGNVSFTIDWSTALAHVGSKLYYLDQQKTSTHVYTRVLLTYQSYEYQLAEVTQDHQYYPLLFQGGGRYKAAHLIISKGRSIKHVLEIGIEVDAQKAGWLFSNCKIQTNNHSEANSVKLSNGGYKSYICHRHNNFRIICPSPYNKRRTKQILDKKCPGMLQNLMPPAVGESLVLKSQMGSEFTKEDYQSNYDNHERSVVLIDHRTTDYTRSNIEEDEEHSDEVYGGPSSSGFRNYSYEGDRSIGFRNYSYEVDSSIGFQNYSYEGDSSSSGRNPADGRPKRKDEWTSGHMLAVGLAVLTVCLYVWRR